MYNDIPTLKGHLVLPPAYLRGQHWARLSRRSNDLHYTFTTHSIGLLRWSLCSAWSKAAFSKLFSDWYFVGFTPATKDAICGKKLFRSPWQLLATWRGLRKAFRPTNLAVCNIGACDNFCSHCHPSTTDLRTKYMGLKRQCNSLKRL